MKPEAILPTYIDSTMLTCFRSCPEKFRLEFVYGLRPPGLSIDLHAGACFALAIETVYRAFWEEGKSLQDALVKAHGVYAVAWGDFEIPTWKATGKTFDRVWEAVEEYFKTWTPRTDHIQPYFTDGKATFEYTFSIPLEPVVSFDPIRTNMFTDIKWFDWLQRVSAQIGWVPFRRPGIWGKSDSEGLAPWGSAGFRITTEFFFYATKGQKGLLSSPTDYQRVNRVSRTERVHGPRVPVHRSGRRGEAHR